ncbi:unnamed protein product [Closterium sp. Naga37s-1]|nr:unnamed protein product [Closterium sp. Naga37s-1]
MHPNLTEEILVINHSGSVDIRPTVGADITSATAGAGRAAGSNNYTAALGGLVGQAEGRTSADAVAGQQFRRAAGSNNDAAALGGLVGQAEGRTSADAVAGQQFRRAAGSNNDAGAEVRTSSMELEEARAAHRALQRENQRLLNENSDLRRNQSMSASPGDPATNSAEQHEASPNTGVGSRNVQSERHPLAPINDRLLGRAVGNAHVRGVEHGVQHLTAEQEVLVFDLAAAMRRVPEVNKGLYVAMLDAITILFWELADDKMDFWPSRRVLLGAICAALKYKTAEQRWDLLNVYLYDPVRRRYIRNKLQDECHIILTKGRCELYKAYDLYIQRPDKNRQLMGSTLIDAWKVQYKPGGAVSIWCRRWFTPPFVFLLSPECTPPSPAIPTLPAFSPPQTRRRSGAVSSWCRRWFTPPFVFLLSPECTPPSPAIPTLPAFSHPQTRRRSGAVSSWCCRWFAPPFVFLLSPECTPPTPAIPTLPAFSPSQTRRRMDVSFTLHTWHCSEQGVPFSNAVFTRGIAASFRREGEDVLILKLRQIAFWLFGVSRWVMVSGLVGG